MSKYLYVVDEKNHPLDIKLTRKEAHKLGYWHRTNHIWVVDSKKRLLFVKRGAWKSQDPGKWASYVGGHKFYGESSVEAAARETKEELGFNFDIKRFTLLFVKKNKRSKEFNETFLLKLKPREAINPSKSEFTQFKFIKPSQSSIAHLILDNLSGGSKYLRKQIELLGLL